MALIERVLTRVPRDRIVSIPEVSRALGRNNEARTRAVLHWMRHRGLAERVRAPGHGNTGYIIKHDACIENIPGFY